MAKAEKTKTKKTSIGGQALIEGIMMRGPFRTAMAVRNMQGQIVLEEWENDAKTPKILKIPIIRGVYGMISSFAIGYKCLMRSADIAFEDAVAADNAAAGKDAEAKTEAETAPEMTEAPAAPVESIGQSEIVRSEGKREKEKTEKTKEEKKDDALFSGAMVIATVIGVALSIGLFILVPSILAALLIGGDCKLFGWEIFHSNGLFHPTGSARVMLKSVIEGVLKIAILVLYMWGVSFMKDIRKTFMYHGAEHKTIFCYEQGLELTVENIRIQRRFHPRCGTSFLILMLLVSILIGFFITAENALLRFVIKLALLPLTVGIGYELIKFAGRHDNILTKIISAPGVALQHITTKEPTDDMIECAIVAMKEVIPEDPDKDNW